MFNTLFDLFICVCLKPKAARTRAAVSFRHSYQHSSRYLHSFCMLWLFVWLRQNEMLRGDRAYRPVGSVVPFLRLLRCVWFAVLGLGSLSANPGCTQLLLGVIPK